MATFWIPPPPLARLNAPLLTAGEEKERSIDIVETSAEEWEKVRIVITQEGDEAQGKEYQTGTKDASCQIPSCPYL